MPKARLLIHIKEIIGGRIREVVVWLLSDPLPGCTHCIKYRLYYGVSGGECLVRYDNERGKGDHRHLQGKEEAYRFSSVEMLLRDFDRDIRSMS